MQTLIDIEKFNEDGFLILKHDFITALNARVQHALKLALRTCVECAGYDEFRSVLDEEHLKEMLNLIVSTEATSKNKISPILYEVFPKHPHLMGLLDNDDVLSICKSLGLKFPMPATIPVTRIDRPNNDFYNTPWHQDSWYTLFSPNAVTFWMPILPLTPDMGLMQIIPGSHKRGVLPFRKFEEGHEPYVLKDSDCIAGKSVEIPVAENEILVFNQSLIHRSGKNRSKGCRMSLQLRFNDLASMKRPCSTFTPIHSKSVQNEQQRLLQHWEKNEHSN